MRLMASGQGHRFEKITFLSSGAPEASATCALLADRYGNAGLDEADVVVALGGDGLMLQVLHRFMGRSTPIYGMNRGSVGFLMNEFKEQDLIDRGSTKPCPRSSIR